VSTPAELRRAFGWSLLVEDGDLVLDGDGALVEVEGEANLQQALALRILTPYASDRFNVAYGLDYAQVFGATEGLALTRELLKLNLVRALATDARVAEVTEVVFLDDGDSRVSRRWQVELRIVTVAGEDATLTLGIGG
jgi:hypothetical protein